jgi:cytochrome c oxidase cbb3-type subunit 3
MCSSHGVDGTGIDGKAQDLTKRMAKDQILHVIKNGANNLKSVYPGGMPGGMAAGADADAVAAYVAGGMKGTAPAAWAICAGCHGQDGKGIAMVGPDIKTYSDSLVTAVLKDGKKGNIGAMPGFEGMLTDTQMKAVANYIRSIGE